MNPLITNGMRPVPLSSIKSEDLNSVSVALSETEKLAIKYCLPASDGYDPNELRVFLLEKQNLPEQTILEIKLDSFDEKAGHIFPLRLFETEDATYTQIAKDTPRILRFQKVALAALCHFAKVNQLALLQEEQNDPVSLVKYFGEDAVVLTISNDPNRAPENFELDDYLPSLFKYGYFKYEMPTEKAGLRVLDAPFEDVTPITTLTLKKISSEIPNASFVKKIFVDLLPAAWSPITSFFLCYQVIEICIERIRLEHCDAFISNLETAKKDAVMTRTAINEYQGEASEKDRIKRLFTTYISPCTNSSFNEGKNLLKRLGQPDSKLVEDCAVLYSLRNYYFHAFPVVQDNCSNEQLKMISWELLVLTLEILFRFKLPPPVTV